MLSSFLKFQLQNKMLKFFLNFFKITVLIFASLALAHFFYKFKNPGINRSYSLSCFEALEKNDITKKQNFNFKSSNFQVRYITNAPKNTINPNFPIIEITLENNADFNAWIQVVRTDDFYNPENHCFIDSISNKNIYPFYSLSKTFYDNPIWHSSLFLKPLRFWKAHVYAIKVDKDNVVEKCLGGISWGWQFKNNFFCLGPNMILPQKLSLNDWNTDLKIFDLKTKIDNVFNTN